MTSVNNPVLVSAVRTPIGRLGGGLASISAVELGVPAISSALEQAGAIAPEYVLLGNVVQAGNGQNPARLAAVRAGVSTTTPAITLNDVCLASMSAVRWAASLIRSGEISSALVGGFESMTGAPHAARVRATSKLPDITMRDLLVHDGLWCGLAEEGMGELSDTENARLGISRADQDEFAALSHHRAARARQEGVRAEEIVPVAEVAEDEGIRENTDAAALARLPSAFTASGSITAGNSAQLSDAASAGVLTSAGLARARGVSPLAEIVDAVVVAGPDTTLHAKPAVAARELLKRNGLDVGDIGLWEINEAFAGVVLASVRELGIEVEAVNSHGGAIALGHPLGASGFRLLLTLARQLHRHDEEFGVATLCGGGGQGQAILLRRPG